MPRVKLHVSKQFVLRCLESICPWISSRCERQGKDLKFPSDHLLLLTDGNQPAADQTMLDSDHSHCGTGGVRKHRVMMSAFKYTKLFVLFKIRWKCGGQQSVCCAQKIKKHIVDYMKNKEECTFSMCPSMEIVKHYVVFLTLLLLGEPTGTTWGGFISLILITLITHYWLCAKAANGHTSFLVKRIKLNETHSRIWRHYKIRHHGN